MRNATTVLETLRELTCEIFFQDAVFLRDAFPDNPIYKNGVFNTSMWRNYADRVKAYCAQEVRRVQDEADARDPARILAMMRATMQPTHAPTYLVQPTAPAPAPAPARALPSYSGQSHVHHPRHVVQSLGALTRVS